MTGELETACKIVLAAGRLVREKFASRRFNTDCKDTPADFVTDADRQSQDIIMEGLARSFPGHLLVAEEKHQTGEAVLDEKPAWFIDPLDGTTNFVFGIPFCAVTIARTVAGIPTLGIIYDPLREELFTCIKGEGAFLNNSGINIDRSRKTVGAGLITTGFPIIPDFKDKMWGADYKRLFYQAANVRSFGAAALELAYVACGRLTGYWEVLLRPWDVLAGMLLVTEAGGCVSNLEGGPLTIGEYMSIAASNGLIHGELIEILGYKKH